MSTYTQIFYHIIFATKNRERTLDKENRENLFRYIWGLLKNKKCKLYQINGIEDHIHLVMHVHPSISLSSLIKDIKLATVYWNKQYRLFPHFTGWQNGYGAFTFSVKDKERVIEYVKQQEAHHCDKSFESEYKQLLRDYSISFDNRYLF